MNPKTGVYFDGVIHGYAPKPNGMIVGVLPEEHTLISMWLESERVLRYSCSCEGWSYDYTYEAFMTEGPLLRQQTQNRIRNEYQKHAEFSSC